MNVELLPPNMLRKVTVAGVDNCWEWTGGKNSKGYAAVGNDRGGSMLAHRKSYELLVGPIPEGFTLDHLCENRPCINPDHLEPVTRAENSRREGHLIGRCPRCGSSFPGVSQTLRARGNPQYRCARCEEAALARTEASKPLLAWLERMRPNTLDPH